MDLPGSRRLGASALLGRLGELFIADRLREATQLWSFPCPVEVAGELTVMKDAEELEAFFRSRHDRARAAGMTALVPRIIAIEMPRKHRFRVWLRWVHHFDTHDEEEEHTSVFYFVRKPWGGLSIEMMDIVRLPDVGRAQSA